MAKVKVSRAATVNSQLKVATSRAAMVAIANKLTFLAKPNPPLLSYKTFASLHDQTTTL